LLATLEEFYAPEVRGDEFSPHADQPALKARIEEVAPPLKKLTTELTEFLEQDYSAIIIEQLWLADYELNTQRKLMYCFALATGWPTPTDRINRQIVWDIKERHMPDGYVTTFSENSYEADLHTDTQYFPTPEKYLFLYFVKPAACGGGVSMLYDGRAVKAKMAETEAGRRALAVLETQKLPFRIPRTYTTDGKADTLEVTYASIFSGKPFIRYRTDTLDKGLAAFPQYNTPAVREAVAAFRAVIFDRSQWLTASMKKDSLLLANNHTALHGRTAFSDPQRHAIRIRIADSNRLASE
jgi:alpha-ketoglutarate-dependent taurine dioxygenase